MLSGFGVPSTLMNSDRREPAVGVARGGVGGARGGLETRGEKVDGALLGMRAVDRFTP
jgi:hypothetical protein